MDKITDHAKNCKLVHYTPLMGGIINTKRGKSKRYAATNIIGPRFNCYMNGKKMQKQCAKKLKIQK